MPWSARRSATSSADAPPILSWRATTASARVYALLASDNVSDARKQRAAGGGPAVHPPEDEAEVLANRAKKARAQES